MQIIRFHRFLFLSLGLLKITAVFTQDKISDIRKLLNLQIFIARHVLDWPYFSIVTGNNSDVDILNGAINWNTDRVIDNFPNSQSLSLSFVETLSSTFTTEVISSANKFYFISFIKIPADFKRILSNAKFFYHSWLLVLVSSEHEKSKTTISLDIWLDHLQSSVINFDSDLWVAVTNSSSNTINIYEIYRKCVSCKVEAEYICLLNFQFQSISMTTSTNSEACIKSKYLRRANLRGVNMTSVGVDAIPVNLKIRTDENGTVQLNGGMYAQLVSSLVADLNVSFAFNILNGYQYGNFINGSWTGIMGYLSRGEVDMTISELSMASDRLKLVDFTFSTDIVVRKIYIQKIVEKRINWKFYTSPFERPLRIAIAIFSTVLTFSFWILSLTLKLQSEELILTEIVWITLCSLCQRGAHIMPTNERAKAIFILMYFHFLILFIGYSAILITQLSLPQPIQLPFSDLNGLIKAKGWKGGPINRDLMEIYMNKTCPDLLAEERSGGQRNIQCEQLVKLRDTVVRKSRMPLSFEEGFKAVIKGKFAFIAAQTGARDYINNLFTENEACQVHEMKGEFLASNLALGLRKNGQYRHLLNSRLLALHQSGILKRLKNTWLPKLETCDSDLSIGYTEVSIYDVATAPMIAVLGFLLSGCLLLFEICWRLVLHSHPASFASLMCMLRKICIIPTIKADVIA